MLSDKQKALVYHMHEAHDWTAKEAIAAIIKNDIDEDDLDRVQIGYSNCGERDFSVFTGDEADSRWDEYLESYIDDCLELPAHLENYFDRETWKSDARMELNGRGRCLNSWDGWEWEYEVNGKTYYIYEN